MAGKNRSNIASSILLNGEVLEDVFNASQNDYFNSSNEELDKYLDSIEGKVAKLKNRLQELASVSISSDWLKVIIDLGTNAISVITTLSEKFGGLNLVIGGIVGGVLQKNGLGKQLVVG